MKNNIHGIDHVGVTVPNLEQATDFFVNVFEAIVLYDTLKNDGEGRHDKFTQQRLGILSDMTQMAIRMLALPNGAGLELFEFKGSSQKPAITPADIGWNHIAIYVDDIDQALAKVEAAGGKRNADPIELSGLEAGKGNFFCYVRTPWESTLELISYPSPQPYLDIAPRRKWSV